MSTMQEQWAAQIREMPAVFRLALLSDEQAIRHRPATGEWSAIEVVGHMIDKVGIWTSRVERLLAEERPTLAAYDQDALVREHDYQHADPEELFERLRQTCERFASLIEQVSLSALEREGVHEAFGPITLRQCIVYALEACPEHLKQLQAAQTLG